MDYNGAGSYLYKLNEDLTTDSLAEVWASGLLIGIAGDGNGTLYGVTLGLTDDLLYSYDIASGTLTEVGALGLNLEYAQDIGYDRGTDQLYGTLYTTEGGFYSIDVSTGAATLVTGVLWDFRGYEPLGEATMLFTAAVGVLTVLRLRGKK